ncbi:MAG TPA: chorismate synthase [Smithellaceae bacterium]|nr:chorismate synthase [Smithellaceae bacterium]HRS88891.1 chorismate synthase [Smithellaceae bacterium]HRV26230.1 chorismate synthase [Smithellaceae bacterium]
MSGNTIGSVFRVTTWGESHGAGLGAVVDGCPPGVTLAQADIQAALDRRRPSNVISSTKRKETDKVEILSGVFEGKTTGTPISLLIRNTDADSSAYHKLKDVFRPGQGDFTYWEKYGRRDWRGGGRASGRETVARVAAGAVAQKVITRAGMEVLAYTVAIGDIEIDRKNIPVGRQLLRQTRASALFCPDKKAAIAMEEKLAAARQDGDSLGGVVEIIARHVPAGLGEPVFDKMDADLAKALMSIGTVKAVEVGDGCAVSKKSGSQVNDLMNKKGFQSNHAGGILAGITTGQDIVLRAYCKPIPSISQAQKTVDIRGKEKTITITGRHDVCVIPRIVPVCEAMVCIVLADHLLRQRAISNG